MKVALVLLFAFYFYSIFVGVIPSSQKKKCNNNTCSEELNNFTDKSNDLSIDDVKYSVETKSVTNTINTSKSFEYTAINSLLNQGKLSVTTSKDNNESYEKTEDIIESTSFPNNIFNLSYENATSFNNNIDLTTTEASDLMKFQPFLNITNQGESCFCDLTFNSCDVNCCCDRDCNTAHWRVFTECEEIQSEYDVKHCFKSNIIFYNNTKLKIIKTEKNLFCLIRDNLEKVSNLKNKDIITSLENFKEDFKKPKFTFAKNYFYKFKATLYQFKSLVWSLKNNKIEPLGKVSPMFLFYWYIEYTW